MTAANLNRSQRRAMNKAGRKRAKPSAIDVLPVNPMFAMNERTRVMLSKSERVAFDALLTHCATLEHIAELETLIHTAIRAILLTQNAKAQHLEAQGLADGLKLFHRAAWAIRRSKLRHQKAGVYGLDAEDREALILADHLIADMRKPGVILRKTWMAAFRESYSNPDLVIPAFEELASGRVLS